MKKIIRILSIVFTMLIHSNIINAYDIEVDGVYYNIYATTKTAEVTNGEKVYSGDIIIPVNIKYYGYNLIVNGINDDAFKSCDLLTSIVLPSTINKIGKRAFMGCSSLKYIPLPANIIELGESAFQECVSLKSIIIPSALIELKDNLFSGCTSLTSIKISDSVESIGNNVFKGCSSLNSINLPNKISSLGESVFSDCTSLTYVNIPSPVKVIMPGLFKNCFSLTSIILPDDISKIGDEAFSDCYTLSTINIPKNATCIGQRAFQNCSSLTSIIMDNSKIIEIQEEAFLDCIQLKQISLSKNLNEIGDYAFEGCESLTELDFPDSLTFIGWNALLRCNNLNCLRIGAGINSIINNTFWGCKKVNILEFKDAPTAFLFGDLEDSYTPTTAFQGCDLKDVQINTLIINRLLQYVDFAKIESFGSLRSMSEFETPFFENIYIENIILGGSFQFSENSDYVKLRPSYDGSITKLITYRDVNCFQNPNLKEINIKNSDINTINNKNFRGCKNVSSIILNGIVQIEENAFKNFSQLNNIKLGNVRIIKSNAFEGCNNLRELEMPSTIESISNSIASCPLSRIVFKGKTPPSSDNFDNKAYLNCKLMVPYGSKEIYSTTSPWSNFWHIEEMEAIIPTSIILNTNELELEINETSQLYATIFPDETSDKTVIWKSNNESIASVSDTGLVTAKGIGNAKITASCGEVSTVCEVTVVTDTNGLEEVLDEDIFANVYSIDGVLIKKQYPVIELNNLEKGLYIIQTGNRIFKLQK